MKRALALLLFPAVLHAAAIPAGSKVYVQPMEGYGAYVTAALAEKGVPVTVVTDPDQADYTIAGSMVSEAPAQPTTINLAPPTAFQMGAEHNARKPHVSSSLTVVDAHTHTVAAAFSTRSTTAEGAAEGFAKKLRKAIEKP